MNWYLIDFYDRVKRKTERNPSWKRMRRGKGEDKQRSYVANDRCVVYPSFSLAAIFITVIGEGGSPTLPKLTVVGGLILEADRQLWGRSRLIGLFLREHILFLCE